MSRIQTIYEIIEVGENIYSLTVNDNKYYYIKIDLGDCIEIVNQKDRWKLSKTRPKDILLLSRYYISSDMKYWINVSNIYNNRYQYEQVFFPCASEFRMYIKIIQNYLLNHKKHEIYTWSSDEYGYLDWYDRNFGNAFSQDYKPLNFNENVGILT